MLCARISQKAGWGEGREWQVVEEVREMNDKGRGGTPKYV